AFVGLDPLEKSSGETRRIGSISKRGSRLARYLLGQAAQASREKQSGSGMRYCDSLSNPYCSTV
ncbi:MAG: transposase, partial [Pyrinomonadaceae bacterium]|nr:transposase [Pyrinomonadaceae bacterium]